ncbi:MAG: hypothetical protein ACO1OB_12780, partial [Archangium sp.]
MNSLAALILAASVVTPPQPSSSILNTDTGAPKFEAGVLSAPLPGDLTNAVRGWALSQRERYGLPIAATLKSSGEFTTRFGASFHLQETVKDLEVYEAKLVVTIDSQRRVEQISSSLKPFVQVLDGRPMSLGDAMKLAAKELPLVAVADNGVPYGGAKAFYFRVGDDLHKGFVANVQTLDATKNWYVGIDAVTGERLFVQNRVHHASLDARVYPISPGGLDAGVGVTPTVLRELRHTDGGSMLGDVCVTAQLDGGFPESQNDGGQLCGTQLMMYNCCPTEGCVTNGSARRVQGSLNYPGVPVPIRYDVAICDRVRRASNATNPTGDFVYTPVDPPTNRTVVEATDPANSDAFAEVHSFYHVNTIYDWMRGLSGTAQPIFAGNPTILPFRMRDEKRTPAVKPVVWANAMFPNYNEIFSSLGCIASPPCRADTLLRLDNAAFFPRENFAQLPLPGFDTGADTLMIFQGNAADAAYDATVLHHEFGHGAIYATAALTFDDIALDARSANNEGGALHEGIADYLAGAFSNVAQIGPYFGPRAVQGQTAPGVPVDGYLRSLDNQNKCPEVLWGEVHQDGMHVAEAMWQARSTVFAGTDNGATFDAAVYAMLVSITPNADFALVTSALAARVATAFPANTMASAQLNEIFSQRGVINCSKVLDVNATNLPRLYFGVTGGSGDREGVQSVVGQHAGDCTTHQH